MINFNEHALEMSIMELFKDEVCYLMATKQRRKRFCLDDLSNIL